MMLNIKHFKIRIIKFFSTLIIGLAGVAACTGGPQATTSETLVNAANKTLINLMNRRDLVRFNSQLRTAAGVAIFPSVYKAGFFAAAGGGNGILISKNSTGAWGYPAFYTLASGSWGIQFGGQKSGVVLIIRNRGAVEALMQHQGKLSAGMNVAAGNLGTGLEGGITTNLGADIVAYSDSKGLFTGVAIKGSAMVRRNDLNSEYYGKKIDPKSIIIQHAHQNPQANILRNTLNQ